MISFVLLTLGFPTALHVKPGLPAWTECADVNYKESWPSVLPIYPALMAAINVTIYTGMR